MNSPQHPRTWSERKVASILQRQLDEDDVLIHGVRFTDAREGDVEIDTMAFLPGYGVAVIEIKGGLVTYEDGQWWTTLRRGKRRVSPVAQARAGKHAFRSYIARQDGEKAAMPRVQWFVAMPRTQVMGDMGPEGRREQLIGGSDLGSMLDRIRTELLAVNDGSLPPSVHDVDQMLQHLHRINALGQSDSVASDVGRQTNAFVTIAATIATSGLIGFFESSWFTGTPLLAVSMVATAGLGAIAWGSARKGHNLPRSRSRVLGAAVCGLMVLAGAGVAHATATEPTLATSCQPGYAPCLPVVKDLDCKDIHGTVQVTGEDPYFLDRDKDGIGCELNGS